MEEQQVLSLIQSDADQARYFFSRARSLKWFPVLKEIGYLSPDKVPYDSEGKAQFWDILQYLERVSEQLHGNPEYGEGVIGVLEWTFISFLGKRDQSTTPTSGGIAQRFFKTFPSLLPKCIYLRIDFIPGLPSGWSIHGLFCRTFVMASCQNC